MQTPMCDILFMVLYYIPSEVGTRCPFLQRSVLKGQRETLMFNRHFHWVRLIVIYRIIRISR